MKVIKHECPSCGAPLVYLSNLCTFCNTEVFFFDESNCVLPRNLSKEAVEKNIVLHEREFWRATAAASRASYTIYRAVGTDEQYFKDRFFRIDGFARLFRIFYEAFLILPKECFVELYSDSDFSENILITSYRIILIRGSVLLAIPFDQFVSFIEERSLSGGAILGKDGIHYQGQGVLRYMTGNTEKIIRFEPTCFIPPAPLLQSVISSRDWENLSPFQRNFLSISRHSISARYNIHIAQLELMSLHFYADPERRLFFKLKQEIWVEQADKNYQMTVNAAHHAFDEISGMLNSRLRIFHTKNTFMDIEKGRSGDLLIFFQEVSFRQQYFVDGFLDDQRAREILIKYLSRQSDWKSGISYWQLTGVMSAIWYCVNNLLMVTIAIIAAGVCSYLILA
jgi:hypothetical protein